MPPAPIGARVSSLDSILPKKPGEGSQMGLSGFRRWTRSSPALFQSAMCHAQGAHLAGQYPRLNLPTAAEWLGFHRR
jgi:hypothetical protein